MNLFYCLLCSVYTHVIALCSNSSNTLMKLVPYLEMQRIGNYSHPLWVQYWVFVMILSVNVFTIAIKTFTKECILIVWLFLMKIGCFGIFMIKNMITRTFQTKCLNFIMCITFRVKTFSGQQLLKCDCLLYER